MHFCFNLHYRSSHWAEPSWVEFRFEWSECAVRNFNIFFNSLQIVWEKQKVLWLRARQDKVYMCWIVGYLYRLVSFCIRLNDRVRLIFFQFFSFSFNLYLKLIKTLYLECASNQSALFGHTNRIQYLVCRMQYALRSELNVNTNYIVLL